MKKFLRYSQWQFTTVLNSSQQPWTANNSPQQPPTIYDSPPQPMTALDIDSSWQPTKTLDSGVSCLDLGKIKMYCQAVKTYQFLSIAFRIRFWSTWVCCGCWGLSRTVKGFLELLWTVVGCRGVSLAVLPCQADMKIVAGTTGVPEEPSGLKWGTKLMQWTFLRLWSEIWVFWAKR